MYVCMYVCMYVRMYIDYKSKVSGHSKNKFLILKCLILMKQVKH